MKLRIPAPKPGDGAKTVEVDAWTQVAKVFEVDVPAILDGDSANVVIAGSDDDFVGCMAMLMMYTPDESGEGAGNPPDNLASFYAWASNQPAGQITCRFGALNGNVAATANQLFLIVGYKPLVSAVVSDGD